MTSYANMKLKVDSSKKTINVPDTDITFNVFNYLPIEQKYDLIMITLQEAEENGFYNPLKLDMHFHLNLIYSYTDISFTEKQREDEGKIYDALKSNGVLDAFLAAIPEEEYAELYDYLISTQDALETYSRTLVGFLQKFVGDMPKQAEAMADIVKNFDKEKFTEVIEFAKAANGGRDIN